MAEAAPEPGPTGVPGTGRGSKQPPSCSPDWDSSSAVRSWLLTLSLPGGWRSRSRQSPRTPVRSRRLSRSRRTSRPRPPRRGWGRPAPPRPFLVPGCLAAWESYEHVSDARWAALLDGLASRRWQLTGRLKRPPTVASSLTKGAWQLLVVHEKRPGTREHLSLLATNGTPACEEAFKQAQAMRHPGRLGRLGAVRPIM